MYMHGFKITIQKPDGTTEVIGPFNSYLGDDTAWLQYVVDQVGTWKFKFEQPGTYIPKGLYVTSPGEPGVTAGFLTGQMTFPNGTLFLGSSILYTASSTDWQELTVQQEWVNSWPSVPLPTDYWTRPVSPENREWWTITGNYPWTGAYYYPNGRVLYSSNYKYTPYVQAPNTAHVVWKRQGAIAGLVGGDAYQYSAYTGGGTPSIIYAGRCYQTLTKQVQTYVNGSLMLWPTTVWECYDLRTGQVYWDIQGVTAPTNIVYEPPIPDPDEQMVASAGWGISLVAISGGRLYKYNPYTGAATLNISLPSYASSGTIYNGEWVYTVQTINASAGNYRLLNWTMRGTSTNFTTRIGTNITWPRSTLGTCDYDAGLAVVGTRFQASYCLGYDVQSVDLRTGAELFHIVSNDTLHGTVQSGSSTVVHNGKVAMNAANRHWNCWDARTGKKLWESDLSGYPWGNWWAYNTASYDFNESKSAIIGSAYDGIYAIDWDTGHILWHYSDPMPPFESPYGGGPFFTGVNIADGKVYAYSGEHTTSQPITRGWKLNCINATTGKGIWKITGPMSPGAVADGYLTASNPYDGYMYVFGKGKSATTVTASPAVIAKGATTLIQGKVLDQSPAQAGTPCVSAASMETQMEYLHMQHPQDGLYHNETVTGVPVLLMAFDSNNNYITIGTATSDVSGSFQYAWTPPNEGVYKITATFAGDDSYGSSWEETGLSVGPAPASPTPTPEQPQTQPDNTPLYMLVLGVGIAIIIAVAIVGIMLYRKRP
jgi:hypothetical protein